jgi:hypothetical protein
VISLVAVGRHDGPADAAFASPIAKVAVIVLPDATPFMLNLLPDF